MEKAKAVIIKDQNFVTRILRGMLENLKMEVVELNEELNDDYFMRELKKMEKLPDLIIVDLKWRESIKTISQHFEEPVIIGATTLSDPKTIIQAIRYGAKHILSIPFSEGKLYEIICSFPDLEKKVFVSSLPDYTDASLVPSLLNGLKDLMKMKTEKMHQYLSENNNKYSKEVCDYLMSCVISTIASKEEPWGEHQVFQHDYVEIKNNQSTVIFHFNFKEWERPEAETDDEIEFLRKELEEIEDIFIESEVFFNE